MDLLAGQDTFEAILQHQSYTTYLAETSAGRSAGYLTVELPGDHLAIMSCLSMNKWYNLLIIPRIST